MLRLLLALFISMASSGAAAQASSEAPRTATTQRAGDLFVAGQSVRVREPVAGDLIATGGSIDVDAAVAGDAVLFGGNIRLNAPVGESLYAAGGQLAIDATVGRNARIAGGRIDVGRRGSIAGNLSVAGGEVNLDGEVKGYIQVGAGRVTINGPVGGDVIAAGGNVELGPQARIAGTLRYRSRDELRRDPAAQVGNIERRLARSEMAEPAERKDRGAGAGTYVMIAGLTLLGAMFVALLPGFTASVATTLRTRAGTSVLVGFVGLVCIPIAAVVSFLTLIGIPVALLMLVLYVALLISGYVVTGVGIGDWVLGRLGSREASQLGWRVAAAAGALLVIALLGRAPWIGGVVTFAALIAGIGALLMQARRLRGGGATT